MSIIIAIIIIMCHIKLLTRTFCFVRPQEAYCFTIGLLGNILPNSSPAWLAMATGVFVLNQELNKIKMIKKKKNDRRTN